MATIKRNENEYSRLNIRIAPEIKAKMKRAANILGQDLTEFASSILNREAQQVINTNDELVLSESDYKFFIEALDRPAQKPSKRSLKAHREYRQLFKKGFTS